MAEKKDVWAKNNIEPVSDKNQANILGYDYGAGNNCACLAGMPYNGFVAGHYGMTWVMQMIICIQCIQLVTV